MCWVVGCLLRTLHAFVLLYTQLYPSEKERVCVNVCVRLCLSSYNANAVRDRRRTTG